MRKTLLIATSSVCLFFFITGCTKDATTSDSDLTEIKKLITKQPIEQQYAYVRNNFKIIMNELAPLFKAPNFMDYLRAEAAKKFDGDYNVLIKTIIENPMYRQKINYSKIQSALNAFKSLDGVNYDPQIYFPFFEKHLAAKNNITSIANLVDNQEVVLYDGNESAPNFPIYQYDDITDSITATGIYADEPYALANELLIISLNEQGEPPLIEVTGGTGSTQAVVNFRIQTLTIKEGKESWVAGASEIHIKSNGTTWNHLLGGNPNGAYVSIPNLRYTASDELKGHEIKKVSKSDINCGVCATYTVNYPLHTNWAVDNFLSDPIVYTYAIFEYDAWPAALKNLGSRISTPNPAYSLDVINFRSSNTAYGKLNDVTSENYAIYGNVSGLPPSYGFIYYDGHHVNTVDIEFNTVKY